MFFDFRFAFLETRRAIRCAHVLKVRSYHREQSSTVCKDLHGLDTDLKVYEVGSSQFYIENLTISKILCVSFNTVRERRGLGMTCIVLWLIFIPSQCISAQLCIVTAKTEQLAVRRNFVKPRQFEN